MDDSHKMKDPSFQCELVSCGCHNKSPQTGGLKTIGIYSLAVLEAWSWKSRCWPGPALGEIPPLPLPAAGGWGIPWHVAAWISSLPLSSHGFSFESPVSQISLWLFLIRTLSLDLGPSKDPSLQTRSQSQILGLRIWTYIFGGSPKLSTQC